MLGDEVEREAVAAGRDRRADARLHRRALARRERGQRRALAVPHDRVVAVVEPVVGEPDPVAPGDGAGVLELDPRAPDRARVRVVERPVAPADGKRPFRHAAASLGRVEPLLVRAARREPWSGRRCGSCGRRGGRFPSTARSASGTRSSRSTGRPSHLGGELRRPVDLEECVPLADLAVLRQRPSRLAHEPDRRPFDRLAPRGSDEQRIHAPRLAAHGKGAACRPLRRLDARPSRSPARSGCRVEVENTGTVPWGSGIRLAYHWLDERGNRSCGTASARRFRRSRPAKAPRASRCARAEPAGPLPLRVRPRRRSSRLVLGARLRDGRPTSRYGRASAAPRAEIPAGCARPGLAERVATAHAEGYGVVAGAIAWEGGLVHRRPRAIADYGRGPAGSRSSRIRSSVPPCCRASTSNACRTWRAFRRSPRRRRSRGSTTAGSC